MSDPGLAAERTALARRRTTLPFLVLSLLGARAAFDAPVAGLLLAALGAAGAVIATRRSPGEVTVLVVLLAVAGLLLAAS